MSYIAQIELDDRNLPRYTVLVPVFREANIVGQLIKNLGGIDYPTEKLEVLILIISLCLLLSSTQHILTFY